MTTVPKNITKFEFGGRMIGPGSPVLVIAEIGINHEGNVEACGQLIEAAANAGADAIKLQTVDADANYTPGTESHALFSRAALSRETTARMFDLARGRGMEAFTTAGDFATIDWVDGLNPAGFKISSGLLTALPVIRYTAAKGRPMIISTGMADETEIDNAVEAASAVRDKGLGLLQCTALYPAPPETLNLASIGWLERRYSLPTGFSDHSDGIEAAPLAVAAGATVIEKHLTLDRTRTGFDHAVSLDPPGFAAMVAAIRAAEAMRGIEGKPVGAEERDKARQLHRHLVARSDIAEGDEFTSSNVGLMRLLPGSVGLPAADFERVVGRQSSGPVARHQPITEDDLG